MRVLIAALLILLTAPAWAAESPPATTPRGTATLVSDSDSIASGKALRLALRLRLAPGWHTYWQNPGDAGAAPSLDLTLPGGHASPITWPTPTLQREGPLVTYAYAGEVLLPVTVTGAIPGRLAAHAEWLACRDICVPEQADFALNLPAGPAVPAPQAALFAAADATSPRPSPYAASIAPDGLLTVAGDAFSPETVREARFFPIAQGRISNDASQRLTVEKGALQLRLTPADGASSTQPLDGILVVHDAEGQVASLTIAASPGPATPQTTPPTLPAMLGLALLGGLILNLMPCVFPVLAMKAMGIASLSGAARGKVRAEALSYTAGVLLAFLALGGLTIALRAAGAAAGWGFQYTSPAFVALTGWVLFAVGLNLSGVFEIGGGFTGAGQGWASRNGHLGSFFTGLLAVVVATPCTAPFMGAALAAAISAPTPAALATFLALGVGLAVPTLVLAVAPGIARVLPKPGPWMQTLRQALAFPMYAAAAWLVWVASQSAGPQGVLGMLAGALLIAFAAWALGAGHRTTPRTRRTINSAALAAVLGALALLPGLANAPQPGFGLTQTEGAEPFTAARLANLREAGRPVFVNLTAAWCVTCLINERVALHAPEVRQAFTDADVAYLVGDWTRQDPALTRFLRSQGRDGVPLYLFYPAGGKQPVALPQILTAHTVLQAIGAAS